MTDKPSIAAILATGRMEFLESDPPLYWRAADLGLRYEVIDAALRIKPTSALHEALLAGRPVQFRDDELELLVRWSPE